MREDGLQQAIQAAGGIGALARALGVSQPAVSNWQKIPAERVLSVEAITGVARSMLRPDLYPRDELAAANQVASDEIDILRAHEYDLLAVLLGRAPTREVLDRLSDLKGDASPLGLAHMALAEAAAKADPDTLQREFFDLFIGIGRGELLPYASYYLTGFLHERPLASVRESLSALGIERADDIFEPEDHVAILCEVMAGLAARRFDAERGGRAPLLRASPSPLGAALLRRSRDRTGGAVLQGRRAGRRALHGYRGGGFRDGRVADASGGFWDRRLRNRGT